MSAVPAVDPHGFKRILYRNIALPLVVGVISIMGFVALIAYLLSAMRWVEHSDRVIAGAQSVIKLAVDQETGMRGFLLTGEETYLEPYRLGMPRMQAELDSLTRMVADNPAQVERLRLLARLHRQWSDYANQALALRRSNGNWLPLVQGGRGKLEFDQLRREFNGFLQIEETMRTQRSEEARQLTVTLVVIYLVLNLMLAGGLAWFGRRELLRLSESYNAALQRQNEHAAFLERQAWLRSAQNTLSERLVGQQALAPLARSVLDFLGEHLNVAVAALYVREPVNLLRRVATYGFAKDSERSEALVEAGEGLVGQALLARRVIRLDNVPDNYLKVSSGLGSGAPVSVLLAPIEERRRRQRRAGTGLPAAGRRPRPRIPGAGRRQHRRGHRGGAVPRSGCRTRWPKPSSSTRNCRCSRKSCAPPTRNWKSSRALLQRVAAPAWKTSRPNWSRPTMQLARAGATRWTRSNAALQQAQDAAGGARRRAAARQPLQVGVPGQHVARAAHAAEQLADPGQAAGRQPARAT